jgi:hypothetical protein
MHRGGGEGVQHDKRGLERVRSNDTNDHKNDKGEDGTNSKQNATTKFGMGFAGGKKTQMHK